MYTGHIVMNASPNNSSDAEKRQTLTQTAKFAGDKKGIIITTFFGKVTDCTKEKSGDSQTRKVSPSSGSADTGATNQTKENACRDNSEAGDDEEGARPGRGAARPGPLRRRPEGAHPTGPGVL